MGSTVRSMSPPFPPPQLAAGSLRWRSWPLVDQPMWAWLVPLGILSIGGFVFWLGGSWILALVACAALAAAFWQFLLPVTYEVTSLGLRRQALRRRRLIPWQAIRAYQLRTTGVACFRRPEPTAMDLPNCLFVPYPPDADELLVALRLYLPHAVDVP